jgi:hypothetical protein
MTYPSPAWFLCRRLNLRRQWTVLLHCGNARETPGQKSGMKNERRRAHLHILTETLVGAMLLLSWV